MAEINKQKKEIMNNNKYLCNYGQLKNVKMYPPTKYKYNSGLKILQNTNLPIVQVVNSNCITMAQKFIQMNDNNVNPVVVTNVERNYNFDNDLILSNVKDDSIMLRSNFYKVAENNMMFPLCSGEVVYVKNLFIFRDINFNVNNGAFNISTIVASFINEPKLIKNCMTTYNYFDVQQSIESIFQCAAVAGHNILILDDLGIKYNKIPSSDIVEILNICILRYGSYFKFVIIAYPILNYDDKMHFSSIQNNIINTHDILTNDNLSDDNKIKDNNTNIAQSNY